MLLFLFISSYFCFSVNSIYSNNFLFYTLFFFFFWIIIINLTKKFTLIAIIIFSIHSSLNSIIRNLPSFKKKKIWIIIFKINYKIKHLFYPPRQSIIIIYIQPPIESSFILTNLFQSASLYFQIELIPHTLTIIISNFYFFFIIIFFLMYLIFSNNYLLISYCNFIILFIKS